MKPPICPPQSTPLFESGPLGWIMKLIFGRTWWLFFQGVARGLANLLNFPLYHDLVMFWVGNLAIGYLEPVYPAPPQQRVGPYVFYPWLTTPATGSSVVVDIYRSPSGSDPGGKMATFTFAQFFQFPTAFTYFPDENYTISGSFISPQVTAIGSVTPGADLRIIARVQGAT